MPTTVINANAMIEILLDYFPHKRWDIQDYVEGFNVDHDRFFIYEDIDAMVQDFIREKM